MSKWLIPLLLALAVVCAVLFHIVLPLQAGGQINTVDAYYMLRYAELWPNIPEHDYFFNYPTGQESIPQAIWPAVISLAAKLFHTNTTTAGSWIPPILFLLTLIPIYVITKTLFKSNLVAAIGVFLLAILPGELLQRTMLGAADWHCLEILLATTILMFSSLAIKKYEYWIPAALLTAVYFFSWKGAILIPLIFAIFLVILFYKKWWMWAAAICAMFVASFLSPLAIRQGITLFIPQISSTVSEAMPLFFTNRQFDISAMLAYFNIAYFITLFGVGVLLRQYVKTKSKELLLFLVWTIITLALTFSMRRFAYYLAINVAIITAFASVYIINIFKSSRKRVLELGAALLLICLVLGFRSATTSTSDFGKMPVEWQECCSWLKGEVESKYCFYDEQGVKRDPYYGIANTPVDPSYGVLSHWNYGYWIVEAGHMPASYTPGNWEGNGILCKADITQDITDNKWKFIILDEEMFTSNAYSIFYSNGVKPEDTAVYNLFYFAKPVWQSGNSKVKVFTTQ